MSDGLRDTAGMRAWLDGTNIRCTCCGRQNFNATGGYGPLCECWGTGCTICHQCQGHCRGPEEHAPTIAQLEAEVERLREALEKCELVQGETVKLSVARYHRIMQLEHELIDERGAHAWTQAREQAAIDEGRK